MTPFAGELVHPRIVAPLTGLLTHHPDVHLTSGWRSVAHNADVGGSPISRHLLGLAVDIVGPTLTLAHIRSRAAAYGATEVLNEGDHTHLGWPRAWA